MTKYTWETGIYEIQGSSHPVDGPIEKPWAFGCRFTVLPDGSPCNQGQFDANEYRYDLRIGGRLVTV